MNKPNLFRKHNWTSVLVTNGNACQDDRIDCYNFIKTMPQENFLQSYYFKDQNGRFVLKPGHEAIVFEELRKMRINDNEIEKLNLDVLDRIICNLNLEIDLRQAKYQEGMYKNMEVQETLAEVCNTKGPHKVVLLPLPRQRVLVIDPRTMEREGSEIPITQAEARFVTLSVRHPTVLIATEDEHSSVILTETHGSNNSTFKEFGVPAGQDLHRKSVELSTCVQKINHPISIDEILQKERGYFANFLSSLSMEDQVRFLICYKQHLMVRQGNVKDGIHALNSREVSPRLFSGSALIVNRECVEKENTRNVSSEHGPTQDNKLE